MQLQGSCHCGAVQFEVDAPHPVPFNLCYCSICRKTAGGGGYAINVGAKANSLEVSGREHMRTYASSENMERTFCGNCGSALWAYSPKWPELLHPHASAIDTEIPAAPERTHLMLGSRAAWAEPIIGENDKTFDAYPDESLQAWHERMGMVS
ncbi:MAG: GFA family protein [Boseongicola sp.]|nr:MAG: GFA family protein [Boseongicola sp.]